MITFVYIILIYSFIVFAVALLVNAVKAVINGIKQYTPNNMEDAATSEQEELQAINKEERITIQEETIIQYNKLIDTLSAQYNNETNDKRKAALLKQRIIALEKLNKALEKREKLE